MRVDRDGQMWDLLDLDDGGDIDVWDKGNYFVASYDSSAYKTYSIYTSTAAYNASLGGDHYGSVSSGITNPGYYNAYGPFSVTDDMAVSSNAESTNRVYSANTNLNKTGNGRIKNNIVPGGSYTKVDLRGNIYSYTQFDELGRQTMRIDFQGRPHNGALPHIHLYVYLSRGGRVQYTFDTNWNLLR